MNTLLILGDSDAFAGGFVAGIVEGKSLDESVDMGHWLASLSIKELGPQYVHPLLTPQFIVLAIIAYMSSTSKQHQRKPDILALRSFNSNLAAACAPKLTHLLPPQISFPQTNL